MAAASLPGRDAGSGARGLAGGAISLVAYGLVLWAQTSGALAPIAALRETSNLFGALIGAIVLTHRQRSGSRYQNISRQVARRPQDATRNTRPTVGQGVQL